MRRFRGVLRTPTLTPQHLRLATAIPILLSGDDSIPPDTARYASVSPFAIGYRGVIYSFSKSGPYRQRVDSPRMRRALNGVVPPWKENRRSHLSCRIRTVVLVSCQAHSCRNTRKGSETGSPGVERIVGIRGRSSSEMADNALGCTTAAGNGRLGRWRIAGMELLIWTCFGERWRHSRL